MALQRYTAFSSDPAGGNPAGVVLLEQFPPDAEMQRLAAEVGYSETVFAVPGPDDAFAVRYFSPAAEVPFCGHATIALAVALAVALAETRAETHGKGAAGTAVASFQLMTRVGRVPVAITRDPAGELLATLSSARAAVHPLDAERAAELLAALRLSWADLDPRFPLAVGDSGNLHPIVALADRRRLAALDDDAAALRALCERERWITIQVVHLDADGLWSSRNPFPLGGVREDPATGSAAIALGAYLRHRGAAVPPATIVIEQGRDLGRPGQLTVHIDDADGPIRVSGTAVRID